MSTLLVALPTLAAGFFAGLLCARGTIAMYRRRWREAVAVIERQQDEGLRRESRLEASAKALKTRAEVRQRYKPRPQPDYSRMIREQARKKYEGKND